MRVKHGRRDDAAHMRASFLVCCFKDRFVNLHVERSVKRNEGWNLARGRRHAQGMCGYITILSELVWWHRERRNAFCAWLEISALKAL